MFIFTINLVSDFCLCFLLETSIVPPQIHVLQGFVSLQHLGWKAEKEWLSFNEEDDSSNVGYSAEACNLQSLTMIGDCFVCFFRIYLLSFKILF